MIKPNVYQIVGVEPTSKLPSYTGIGRYPIVYLTRRSEPMCAECATLHDDESNPVSDAGIHWEGPSHNCEGCQCEIESTYGEVGEEYTL